MKKILTLVFLSALLLSLWSCERVEPNYKGVLQKNWGKEGKANYTLQNGMVWTFWPGMKLYQVPLWDQRGEFKEEDGSAKILHLKAADNTEFTSRPMYSYKVIESRAVDVVFDNKQLGAGDDFIEKLADNVIEPRIYDLLKEESRKYTTDQLMADGGSLAFETASQEVIRKEFEKRGLELISFSCQLEFTDKVKEKIDTRNEVNTNISVLDQQIEQQKKENELERLKAEQMLIRSKGLTPQILQYEMIQAWRETKVPLYGNQPFSLLMK